MNLGMLIGRFPPGVVGGAELQAEAWARQVSDRHRVLVITRKGRPDEPDREERDGYSVVRLPVSRVPLLRSALDVQRIERTVEAITPRPDLLLCFQTFISGFVGVRLQRRLGIPALVWVRGEDEYRLTRPRTRRISVAVWREAAGVLVQSESNRAAVLDAMRRFDPDAVARVESRIAVVPNGIDLPEPVVTRGDRVLVVGRLIPDKGVDLVLEAVAARGGSVTIAGDGPERPRLEALAARLGLDARFEGMVPFGRLDRLYREAASFVLASRRGEGLPNVLLEAMAYSRPVIATTVTGVSDLVVDGVNGLLVPPGDAQAIGAALARLEHEPGLTDRIAAGARATAERFAWERVRPELELQLERSRTR